MNHTFEFPAMESYGIHGQKATIRPIYLPDDLDRLVDMERAGNLEFLFGQAPRSRAEINDRANYATTKPWMFLFGVVDPTNPVDLIGWIEVNSFGGQSFLEMQGILDYHNLAFEIRCMKDPLKPTGYMASGVRDTCHMLLQYNLSKVTPSLEFDTEDDLLLPSIFAMIHYDNVASIRMAEHAGMEYHGDVMKIMGPDKNYGLFLLDWQKWNETVCKSADPIFLEGLRNLPKH